MSFIYQAGGALLHNNPTYVQRQADFDALRIVLNGEYLQVIAPRQFGKTSLLKRLRWNLEEDRWNCAYVDLSNFMGSSKALWYKNLGKELARQFTLKHSDPGLTDQIDLRGYLLDLLDQVSSSTSDIPCMALLLDEVESVCKPRDDLGNPFHEEFFMVLRSLYNERDSFKGTFVVVLAGATNPKYLVRNSFSSPFNVAQKISLDDFTDIETKELTLHLTELGLQVKDSVHEAIYKWTQGQPYLTQRTCYGLEHIANAGNVIEITQDMVAQIVEQIFLNPINPLNRDSNIEHIDNCLSKLSEIAKKMWSRLQIGEIVKKNEVNNSDMLIELYLSGAFKLQENFLVIRNRIYEETFTWKSNVIGETVTKTEIGQPLAPTIPPTLPRTSRRSQYQKSQMRQDNIEPPLDLTIELTAPSKGSPPEVIANIILRCSNPINLGPISAGQLTDPFTAGERDKLQWYLEEYWKYADDEAFAKAGKEAEELLPQIGKRLYKQVLEGHGIVYAWLYAPAQRHQITIHSDIPRALNLPWELLHDKDGFLALRPTIPISVVRHFPQHSLIALPTSFAPPLRVLLVISRPKNVKFSDPRGIALELFDEVQNSVDGRNIMAGDIELEFLQSPTLDALRRRLNDSPQIHVLHFDGHGNFNEANERGELFFEQADGNADPVDADFFAQVIQGSVRLVVMTACKSDVGSVDDAFSSVATRLIQGGIDAVVAMSASVLIATATRYTEEFYRALFAKRSVPTAQGQALQALHADRRRSLLRRKPNTEGGSINLLDWWVPHYYQQRPLELQPPQPVRKGKKREASPPAPNFFGMPPEPHYGFSGRSHELLDLERLFRDRKLVVVYGFCGVGKSTFVREAAEWLTRRNLYVEAHFISCEHFGSAILSELERLARIQETMRFENKHMLVIVDSVESILPDSHHPLDGSTYSRLWSVLLDLADKKAGVVLTTSNLTFGDGRLAPGRRVAYLPLKGLRSEDAYVLAKSVLSSLKIDQKRTPYPALTDLLAYLNHHPLAIQLVLPLIEKDVSISEMRNDFYKHLPACVDDDDNRIMTGRRHHSLTTFLEEVPLQGLIEENQALLSRLILFEGGASRSNLLEITDIAEAEWLPLEKSLKRAQLLLTEQIQGNGSGNDTAFLCFHPMLIHYLRVQFGLGDEPLREHYIQCYSRLAKEMHHKDKRGLAKRELANLKFAVRLALEMGELGTAREIAYPVCRLLCRTEQLWECGVLLQWIADATAVQSEPEGEAKG